MTDNLLSGLPNHLPNELFTTLVESDDVRIERIVSHGHSSPLDYWYDQQEDEWVVVLQGAARLEFEHHELLLRPGDHFEIPARVKHRVAWTTPDAPTVWLAVFYHRGRGPAAEGPATTL